MRPLPPSVAFGACLHAPLYLSRELVGQNHVRKKTAFLHINLPRTTKKSARQSTVLCAISLNIFAKKLREFLHFPLKSFRVPRASF